MCCSDGRWGSRSEGVWKWRTYTPSHRNILQGRRAAQEAGVDQILSGSSHHYQYPSAAAENRAVALVEADRLGVPRQALALR